MGFGVLCVWVALTLIGLLLAWFDFNYVVMFVDTVGVLRMVCFGLLFFGCGLFWLIFCFVLFYAGFVMLICIVVEYFVVGCLLRGC